jgi:hypothetical protein
MKIIRSKSNKEELLQKECVKIFRLCKPIQEKYFLYMNHNNGKSKIDGRRLKEMGLMPGVSDLTYLSKTGPIFIELKVGANKQTKVQEEWQNAVERLGYKYFIVSSVAEFCKIVDIKII